MKKLLTLLIFIIFTSMQIQGQSCLPNGITFSIQQQIDDFVTNYPGCIEILGDVDIGDATGNPTNAISNLDGLSGLNSIGGYLLISGNTEISNLSGLDNLTSTGAFAVYNNSGLTDLTGLENLSSVNGELIIQENNSIISLNGLNNLTTISGTLEITLNNSLISLNGLENLETAESIELSGNPQLSSISTLSNIQSIPGYIYIAVNHALSDLTGLDNVTSIDGALIISYNNNLVNISGIQNIDPNTISNKGNWIADLVIKNNSNLSECEVQCVCDFLDLPNKTKVIEDNMSGCNSVAEVEVACLIPPTCTNLTTPTNGSTDVNITTDLSWSTAADATGYKLTVGTSTGGTDILDNEDVGNVTTYDPGNFPCGSDIFVSIVPYNTAGDATGCTEESFTTEEVIANAGSDEEFCVGGSVQLNASGGTTYSWSPTTGLDDPNIYNPTASPTVTTTYTVTVSNDGRCPETDDVIVTVNPNPVPNASATDETANNANDGTATSAPTGGTPIYTYAWSNSETTQTITGLAPGDYTVTVTDANICSGEQTVTVNEYICPIIIVNASATNETGNEFNDGTATANPTGGTSPYTYAWSNGETTQTITGLAPGNYTITVTDSKNCNEEQTVTVAEYVCATLTIIATQEDAQCNGSCDGTITITGVTNGIAPFTYAWSNGATTATNSGLCVGSYTVTVTDDKNCTISETYTISEPDELFANASSTDETGNNFEDGTATAAPTGGTSPYTYAWSNSETTQTITGLAPGNYTVTVTDDNDCIVEQTVTVEEYICATLTIVETQENVSCYDECDGILTVDNVINGEAPFDYEWSTGETTQSIDNLCPNTYTVTVTDSKNCSVTDSYTITEPNELFANASATDETAFEAEDGTATANPSGGTTPYAYEWSTGETTQDIEDLAPGTYTVTVTDDNGCTAEETVSVAEFICPTLSLESSQLEVLCYNDCDGEITITNVINGVSPFTYEWSDGQTTETASDLCAGDYDVTVTDADNCSVVSSTFTITEPDELTATTSTTAETYYNANDGTATVNATGGTPPYTYEWDTGETTQTITDLAPDTYLVTVTDDNGCTVVENAVVDEFICPTLTIFEEMENVYCNGDCDGYITIYSIGNGVAPFEYLWNTGDTELSLDNLCPGTYSVTVTDADNCPVSKTYEITEPDILIANTSSTNETEYGAQDGTAIANPTGGTTPYEYSWDNGEISQSIVNLAPGDYTVTVTDYNDCESVETVTVAEFICPILTIVSSQENVSCFNDCDGSIIIDDITNGVAPFDYEWSNGESGSAIDNLCEGTYSVTVTDYKNCEVIESYTIIQPTELLANASSTDETSNNANDGTATCAPTGGTSPYTYAWSNGETSQSISNLSPGSYTITVTDDNGCTSIESVSVAEFGCLGLAIEINQVNVTCSGECDGTLEVTGITNGAAPFTYTWSTGENTASIDSLCPGSYSVTVIDANNCNIYGTYSISEPAVLSANAVSTNETSNNANNGTATSNPTGGTSPYSFAWSNGETSQAISGLTPGQYIATVTDANLCSDIDTVSIEAYICPDLAINSQSSNASCFGVCDGSIAILSVDNATSPLTYAWNTGQTSASLSNVCAGEYIVKVTDANNCSISDTFIITQPEEIIITVDSTRDVRLNPLGYIAISTNNKGNYVFDWSGPGNFTAKTEDIDELNDFGCYTLTVTDTTTNCSVDSTICLLDKTATYDLEFNNINIYPNPTKDNFIIDFSDTRLDKAEITLYDLSGKQQMQLEKQAKNKVITVESEVLNSGLYIIRIKSAKFGTSFRKVIISK